MNTIEDMQNEMDFYGHCKKFEYIQDYVKFSYQKQNHISSQVVGAHFNVKVCVNILIPT